MRASLYLYIVHYMNSDVIGKSDILSFYFSMCAHVISMVCFGRDSTRPEPPSEEDQPSGTCRKTIASHHTLFV